MKKSIALLVFSLLILPAFGQAPSIIWADKNSRAFGTRDIHILKNSNNETVIADIIIMETKLTDATKLSTRQGEAFTNKSGGLTGRSKKPKNIYNIEGEYQEFFENITVEPTFIKCIDTKTMK